MKKLICILLIALLLCTTGCSWYYDEVLDKSLEVAIKNDQIRIPAISNDVPMMYKDNASEFQGVEIEFAQRLAEKISLKAAFEEAEVEKWEGMLLSKEVDLIFAINAAEDDGYKQYHASQPYFHEKEAIAVSKDSKIQSVEEIYSARVGVSEEIQTKGLELLDLCNDVKVYPTLANALLGLLNGEIDTVVGTTSTLGTYYKENNTEIHLLEGKPLYEYRILCLADNKLGTTVINAANRMIDEGEVDEIVNQWIALPE